MISHPKLLGGWTLNGHPEDFRDEYSMNVLGNTTWNSGIFGQAAEFTSNDDDEIEITGFPNFNDYDVLAFTAWMERTGEGTGRLFERSGARNVFSLTSSSLTVNMRTTNDTSNSESGSITAPLGWNHYAGMGIASTGLRRGWHNGNLVLDTTATHTGDFSRLR